PGVLKMLKEGTMAQRELALEVLARVGPHDQDEIQAYARATYDQLRVRAAKKLGGFGKRKFRINSSRIANCMVRLTEDPNAGVDDLIEHLQGQSAAHREMALEWLEWHGDAAKRAIPAIREVLTTAKQPPHTRFQFRGAGWGWSGSMSGSNQEAIRTKAALLLLKLGATRDMAVDVHIQLVKHPDPAVRQRSVLQLGAAGDQLGDDGVRALRGATFDRDKLVAWDAITALGMIGPAARRAVPRLQTLAAGEDKAKAARAAAALRQIQRAKKKPQEAVRKTATGRDVE
ncbi:MAG: HEAT repeat domain-containing protein, partial [Planctomycetota bacterium]